MNLRWFPNHNNSYSNIPFVICVSVLSSHICSVTFEKYYQLVWNWWNRLQKVLHPSTEGCNAFFYLINKDTNLTSSTCNCILTFLMYPMQVATQQILCAKFIIKCTCKLKLSSQNVCWKQKVHREYLKSTNDCWEHETCKIMAWKNNSLVS